MNQVKGENINMKLTGIIILGEGAQNKNKNKETKRQ